MPALNEMSISDLSKLVAARKASPSEIAQAHIARHRARESAVEAWVEFDADNILAQARRLDDEAPRSPLHGIPLGVKDVMEVKDFPTRFGTKIYADNWTRRDCAAVAFFRAGGAVILGKTVTTEFATFHAQKTRNPHNPAHTPGGSSSGSCAAVADFMAAGALGNQTMGSLIRPCAYNGVVGMKPTRGTVPTAGISQLVPESDTTGVIVRALGDLPLLLEAVARDVPGAWRKTLDAPPRIAVFRGPAWHKAQPEAVRAVDESARRLAAAGAQIVDVPVPDLMEDLVQAMFTMLHYELPRYLGWEYAEHAKSFSAELSGFIEKARPTTFAHYGQAVAVAERARAWLGTLFESHDALLNAPAPSEAPLGLHSTGEPIMNQAWSLSNSPCITFPVTKGPKGLPVGVQLIGARFSDQRLIAVARWAAERIGSF